MLNEKEMSTCFSFFKKKKHLYMLYMLDPPSPICFVLFLRTPSAPPRRT